MELDYIRQNSTSADSSGLRTESKSDTLFQRYTLNLDRTLYPNLIFAAGGIFNKTMINSETDGEKSKFTATSLIPTVSLTLNTPLLRAATGFNKIENTSSFGGQSVTSIRDTYTASLQWSPQDLPVFTSQYVRSHTYDKERISQDIVSDTFNATLSYSPAKNLDIFYQGSYQANDNRLVGLQSQSITNSIQAGYSREFFDRVSLSTTGNFSRQETTVSSKGQGEVPFQLFPFSALSAISDTPVLVVLDQNPALIDGNLTAGSGINIGPVAAGGNNKPRNIGLDFFNPTEVDTLFVWVDRPLPGIAVNAFSWDVYISSDNQNWTLFQTVLPAPFGTFDNRFEITFQKVRTRYIKIVTKPLSPAIIAPPGFDLSNIFVTELQAFLQQPAAAVKGKSSTTSLQYSLNTRTRILDSPYIFHDMSFFYSSSSAGSSSYTLSNGFTITHRLSKVFSTSGRIAMEYSKFAEDKSVAYVFGASLVAVPFSTLNHSLTVSDRVEMTGGQTRDSKSVFLNNSAELYTGVNVNLSGGVTTTTSPSGQKSDGTVVLFGATLVPNPKLTISLDLSDSSSHVTGGGQPDASFVSRNADISFSSSPFKTVYVFASVGYQAQTNLQSGLIQQYALTWSPLQGGALQLFSSYSQSLSSVDNSKVTTATEGIRWNITRRASLDFSYLISKTSTPTDSADVRSLLTSFRTAF